MPYSGVQNTTMGKLESNQSKMINYSADLSFSPDNELVELLWENGQIVMQGQSSRTRKSGLPANISSQSPKFKEKEKEKEKESRDAIIPKIGRYGTADSFMNDFSSSVPTVHIGLVQDDNDMVPWLNYPIDDCLQDDYCSELFSELSGVNMTSLSVQNNHIPVDKNGSFSQGFRNTHVVSVNGDVNRGDGSASNVVGGSSEPTKPRTSQFSTTQQCQSSIPVVRSRVPDFIISSSNNTHQASFCNSSHSPISTAETPIAKMKKQLMSSKTPQTNNTSFMNFSHFSRPAALVKANLQSIGASATDRLSSYGKVSVVGSSPVDSSLIESTNGSKTISGFQGISVPAPKVDLKSSTKPSQEPVSAEQSEAICHKEAFRNNKSPDHVLCQSSSYAASAALGGPENEKSVEPVVASSSVCSGNSAGGASNNPKQGMKRKNQDVEESECQSEDVEDESVDVKKHTTGRGTSAKRSRAAEVHNLSERRRRDRINEKMRALQELIPNCNKVDKASMLDEAIEYLKTLQLQVQIMSMGSGLCMPPMMLPAGMQNMHAPPMGHFSPMGIGMGMGMGMGMGLGMGMLDASCSSGRPLIPVPPMRGTQFPCLPIPGTMSLHGMTGSSLQMFGIPGQGLPMRMPSTPFIPLPGFSTGVIPVSDVSGAACPTPVPDSAPCSSSKDQIQNTNLHTMHKTISDCSQIQTSTQATKESIEQSALVQNDNQASRANSICRYGMASSGRASYD